MSNATNYARSGISSRRSGIPVPTSSSGGRPRSHPGARDEQNTPSYYVVTQMGSQTVARMVPPNEVESELNASMAQKQQRQSHGSPVRSSTRSPKESRGNNQNPNASSFYIIKGSGPQNQTSQGKNVLRPKTTARVYHPTIHPDPNSPTDYDVPRKNVKSRTPARAYHPTIYPDPNSPTDYDVPRKNVKSRTPARAYHPTIYPDPNSPTDYDVPLLGSGRNQQNSQRIPSGSRSRSGTRQPTPKSAPRQESPVRIQRTPPVIETVVFEPVFRKRLTPPSYIKLRFSDTSSSSSSSGGSFDDQPQEEIVEEGPPLFSMVKPVDKDYHPTPFGAKERYANAYQRFGRAALRPFGRMEPKNLFPREKQPVAVAEPLSPERQPEETEESRMSTISPENREKLQRLKNFLVEAARVLTWCPPGTEAYDKCMSSIKKAEDALKEIYEEGIRENR